jgi:regulator of replication initiation timing
MTIGEFQNHTDMYPDFTLYEAACKEYEKKNPDGSPAWDSQAQFCNAYKFNEDGLAERIMQSANERVESWISDNVRLKSELEPLADRCEKLVAENSHLEDENENLRNEIAALSDRVDELSDEVGELPTAPMENDWLRAAMQMALHDAACDDCKGDEILHMIWGFDYLLQELEGK